MKTPTTPRSVANRLKVGQAINHLITVLTVANDEYWARSTEAILGEMNEDIADTLELMAGNTALSDALNTAQDLLNVRDENNNPVFLHRAPVVPGRTDIVFEDGDGAFVVVAPPQEPEPEP